MTIISTSANAAFRTIHRIIGRPSCTVIEPVGNWTLPVGTTYSSRYDQFVDASGNVVTADVDTWSTDADLAMDFIPGKKVTQRNMEIGGIVSTERLDAITILWSSAKQVALAAAWGVKINSDYFQINSWDVYPMGITVPAYITVTLSEHRL